MNSRSGSLSVKILTVRYPTNGIHFYSIHLSHNVAVTSYAGRRGFRIS